MMGFSSVVASLLCWGRPCGSEVRADFVFLDKGLLSVESVEGGPGDLRLMAKQDWFVDLPASRQEPMHSSGEAPRNSEGRRKIII